MVETFRAANSFERLERILEHKVVLPAAFGACLAPKCGSALDESTQEERQRSIYEAALQKMRSQIKMHVADEVFERPGEVYADEDDGMLLNELDLTEHQAKFSNRMVEPAMFNELQRAVSEEIDADDDTSTMYSFPTILDPIDTETLGDIENKCPSGAMESNQPSLPHLPGSYKESVRSKFDYYRKHHAFGGQATLQQVNNANQKEEQDPTNSKQTPATNPLEHQGEDTLQQDNSGNAPDPQGAVPTESTSIPTSIKTTLNHTTKNLSLCIEEVPVDVIQPALSSPAVSRRNELARQILKRRNVQGPSRVGVDP